MTRRFVSPCPPPSPFECELLTIFAEECAEAIQRASKAKRFGLREIQPGQRRTNSQRLAEEIGQVLSLVDQLVKYEIVMRWDIEIARRAKPAKLRRYMQTRPPAPRRGPKRARR